MTLDVKVNIKLAEVVGKVGTWFPCLYFVDSEIGAETYAEYSKLSELAAVHKEDSAIYAAASKLFAQDNAPSKVAVLVQPAFSTLTMGAHANKGWRQLVLVGTHANVADIAEYVEGTENLMLFAGVQTMEALNTLYTAAAQYDKTVIVYHTTEVNAAAAVVGATAGRETGSFTYKNIKIKGVPAEELSAAELDAIHAKGAIAIVEKVGDIVTSEGKAASGEYADNIDSKDYVVQNISYKVQKVFNSNDKVPYTNRGIAMLETATIEALKECYNKGIIGDNEDGTPAYSASFALRSETTETDRATRNYPYGQFQFALAGAIHHAVVNGTISV